MRKDLGVMAGICPMPVLMIATYDENGVIDVMNAAWGMMNGTDKVTLCLSEGHKTTKNIRATRAFTVGLADRAHMREADFFGMASGNKVRDKFERSGLHAEKSGFVNAPVITDFPVVMECVLAEMVETEHFHGVVGRVVNVSADEKVLDENGKVDAGKLNALIFDTFRAGYYTIGEKAGQAWDAGKELMK
ncbi:MAG: flavin reductase family protein [Bacillota bacterium]|jgi:flavin reductase (DIM6/NTAB) family NADH-FMN oxidoreductase RutF